MTVISKKRLSVFGLAMINVIAIDSIRTLPISAEYGLASAFYYLLAAVLFLIPSALVAAELATGWPETGGVYIWVREAFGKSIGFATIWLQWFYNVCWYPTIMSLIAATLAYCFNPDLVNSKLYMLTTIMCVFWGATVVNCMGMRASSMLSTAGAIIGTLIPMIFVTILGAIWLYKGNPSSIEFSTKAFIPDFSNYHNLVLLTAMLYGFVGMEMSAAHAGDVKNPQRDYPKAIFWASIVIVSTMVLGTLAVAVVIPPEDINLVAGVLQAFTVFFKAFHLTWFMPILAIMIVMGAIGGAAAWMIGPTKGLLIASRDGSLPKAFGKVNKQNAPVRLLVMQGIVFTVLCTVFLLMPSVNSAFWALTDITAILALIVYLAMFAAAIKLRYKRPEVHRSFKIPGGKFGLWLTSGTGFLTSLFAIVIGFTPPSQIPIGNLATYEGILATGVFIGCLLPFLIYWISRNRTKKKLLMCADTNTISAQA